MTDADCLRKGRYTMAKLASLAESQAHRRWLEDAGRKLAAQKAVSTRRKNKILELEDKVAHLERVIQDMSDAHAKGKTYYTLEMDMER